MKNCGTILAFEGVESKGHCQWFFCGVSSDRNTDQTAFCIWEKHMARPFVLFAGFIQIVLQSILPSFLSPKRNKKC
ncbi:MAG: hypothetical protein CO030_00175 [Candidatus Magasanikbacteria bacterium CG_4_9_14_0_2_um_filter_42_11]|uniref:Uncharacterized protein n=1 Tax=Candidatus Magasanikbacteria bacterium CG_4_9_14_0_2_um_filter_42_11 TaxID=1974643 RepID=A0A2M8FB65_9BACT|nr:MAG: hypothetical protein COU34_01565 [Candidatus Magasanikbacteria bacterium CG10_big_fil_rev_8_21_14_0_10_43_9]PIY92090.1 MAG: hypothetical protein COY70_05065 [Candidatus Magasanikbacteria bacterium CG_4_10_14_0_8_um_filter_42_12]PJC52952.1 MAG: hypothetical protein CO030_00175 [Candidatus Magasanikbacteria bacterium CG_4_9_14_0_2_um_filter_42_11]